MQIDRAHELAKEYHGDYREQMERPAVKHGSQPQFEKGSFVWAHIPTECRHKLSLHYDGPWEVTEVLGNTYILKKGDVVMHRPQCDLKPYAEPKFQLEKATPNDFSQKSEKVEIKTNGLDKKTLGTWLLYAHILTGGTIAPDVNNPSSSIVCSDVRTPPAQTHIDAASRSAVDRQGDPPLPVEERNQVVSQKVTGVNSSVDAVEIHEYQVERPATSASSNVVSLPPVRSSRLTRELRRLGDFNTAGLRQSSELPAKRKRK